MDNRMNLLALAAVAVIAACSSDSVTNPAPVPPQATVVTASGNIAAKVDDFRNLLGASNGGTAGEQPTGMAPVPTRSTTRTTSPPISSTQP